MNTKPITFFCTLCLASNFLAPLFAQATNQSTLKTPSVTISQSERSVASKTRISLIATGLDTDGKITSYHWKQIGGPSVVLSDIYTDWASFTAPTTASQIELTFEVTVTDNDNFSATALAKVMVFPKSTSVVGAVTH